MAVFSAAVRGLVDLEPDPEWQLKYVDFVDIYVNLSDAECEQYQRDSPEEAKLMASFQTRFEKHGCERSIQRGEAAVLLAQIATKFGPVPKQVRQYIEQGDAKTLLGWSTRILTEDRIEGVLGR